MKNPGMPGFFEEKHMAQKPTLQQLKDNVALAEQAVNAADAAALTAADAAVAANKASEEKPEDADLKLAAEDAVAASQKANTDLEKAKEELEQHKAILAKAEEKPSAAAAPKKDQKPLAPEAAEEAAAPVDPEDDPAYVPIFRDEEGERIPRNSLIRLVTTTGRNLRALDGTLVGPSPEAELKGPDVRKGDWYTAQYQAGLIQVDSVKKMRS